MSQLNEGDLNRQVAVRLQREQTLTDTQYIYDRAVARLQAEYENGKISKEQFDRIILRSDPADLPREVAHAKQAHKNGNLGGASPWLKAGAKWSLQTFERFASVIDVMVQRDTSIAAPVWGSIRVLLVIARDIFDTYERLTEIATNIERCLERFLKYLEMYGRRDILIQRLVDFYYEVIQFSLEATVAYNRGKRRTLGASIWKSIKQPFERFLKNLKECAEQVDIAATLGHMGETHEVRSLIKRQRQQNASPSPPRDAPNFFAFAVPGLLSKDFVGRRDILGDLHKSFSALSAQSLRQAAVWGVPGVGKSQILYRYASENRTAYSSIFHIRAESSAQTLSDYLMTAKLLGLPAVEESELPERLVVEAVKNWLTTRHALPALGNGDVLFSMRDKIAALSLADQDSAFGVEPFQPTVTIEMTSRLLGLASPDSALIAEAEELHRTVGGLPIAIEQTVMLCGRRRKDPLPLVRELQQRRQQVLDQSNPLPSHETYNATGILFRVAMEKLMRDSPQAASLMKVLIFFDTSPYPSPS